MFTGTIMALPFAEHAIEMIAVAPISVKFAMAYLAFLSSALGFVFWSYALEHAEKGFRCNQLYVYLAHSGSYCSRIFIGRNS